MSYTEARRHLPHAAPERSDLLDAPAVEALERLTRLAIRLLGARASFILLVEDGQPLCLSESGFPRSVAPVCGSAREPFLRHLTDSQRPLVIDDARSHGDFRSSPLVEAFGVAAYAGVPLRDRAGELIGAFCVVDLDPRAWPTHTTEVLSELAASAASELDLCEGRRAAEAENGQYRDLLQDVDAIVWEMDLASGQFTFVSQTAEEILGYPVDQWLNEPGFWQDRILHEADRDWALDLCSRATEEGRDHELDYRAVTAGGDVVWFHDRVRVVADGNGKPRLLRGVMVDITEKKRAAEALEDSEQKFREITENMREIFWIFDPDFNSTIYVSPAYEQIWGRSLEEVYRHPSAFVDPVHPEDLAALTKAMREVKTTPLDSVEFRILRPDGSIRWVLARGFPVRDGAGEVYRLVGTTRDITEQKEAEARLTAAEAHYRRLVENAPYAIYALDEEGLFIEINPAGARFLQREAADVLGQHFSTVIAAVDLGVATTAFNQVMAGEEDHLEFEERIRRPSGDVRLLKVTESAIWQDGRIVGTHGIARDITDEAERERQLRRAQRLASIGTLVEGVAHELNNPLHSITNFATLLLEGSGSEEQREDLETIQREALRAARIVSDLRVLTRRTQDEARQRVPVDMNDVVTHVLKTRHYALQSRNIAVDVDLSAGLPAVLADRGQMEQVVLNLIVNAEHAVRDSEERRITVGTRSSADAIRLHVADSGQGIASEHLERVFDPFFTTKTPGEGTGLGLSLVHGIITEHGGGIFAESQVGGGTTFRIELPRAEEAEPTATRGTAVSEKGRSLRILVVDDEPAIRRALVRYLGRRRGHEVDEAADGAEALRMIEGERAEYDVILSDLRMPGLSGDQLLAHLSALGTGIDRRVIFLTGDAASGHAASVLAAAKVPVIYKPVELADVADEIERSVQNFREPHGGE